MKNIKILNISFLILILTSCELSNDDASKETTFYKKENVSTKKLELSIEAS